MSEPPSKLDERIHIRVPVGTRAMLHDRAKVNRRSIGQEAAYLIEKGLQAEGAANANP